MVQDHRGGYPSLQASIESIASKIGCVFKTLNEWVKRVQVDTGVRGGVTSAEAQRVKALERENKELRRANETLKRASIFLHQLSRHANASPETVYWPASADPRDRADLQGSEDRPLRLSQSCGPKAQLGFAYHGSVLHFWPIDEVFGLARCQAWQDGACNH